jgi:hypothetical protein
VVGFFLLERKVVPKLKFSWKYGGSILTTPLQGLNTKTKIKQPACLTPKFIAIAWLCNFYLRGAWVICPSLIVASPLAYVSSPLPWPTCSRPRLPLVEKGSSVAHHYGILWRTEGAPLLPRHKNVNYVTHLPLRHRK